MNRIFTAFFFLLIHTNLFGQTIEGTVINSKKELISDAQILNLATKDHTHSDENGKFLLQNISLGDTLKMSHIGFEVKNITIESLTSPLVILLEEKSISLEGVVISPKTNALNLITAIDLQTNPVNSSQDILRQVPGLVIGQHAGGGKAEQMIFKGF